MNKKIVSRVVEETVYILKTKETIRNTAKKFRVSKSTVHKDLHDRLKDVNYKLYIKIKKIMDEHTDVRHIRGGESTKLKYKTGNSRSLSP